MNGAPGHDSTLSDHTGLGTTWANQRNFDMNHAPGTGLIAQNVNLQSSMVSLYYD